MSVDAVSGITVAGRGVALVTADTVGMAVTVATVYASAIDATRETAQVANRIRAVLDRRGVDPSRRTTTRLSLARETRWENQTHVPVGFRATTTIGVSGLAPGEVGGLLDELVVIGGEAVTIDRIEFEVTDPAAALADARARAFADAERIAQHYAQLAGRALGRVERVVAVDDSLPSRYHGSSVERLALASSEEIMPVETGSTSFVANVEVRWSLV